VCGCAHLNGPLDGVELAPGAGQKYWASGITARHDRPS
jgi:hypothetical protein